MQNLINRASNKIEPVSHDELLPALESGEYSMPHGEPIALKHPEGEIVEVDPSQVKTALSEGFSFPSEAEFSSALNKVKYKDDYGKAILYGGLKGVPFAGGFIRKNIASPEELKGVEEAHPGLTTASEIASTVGGFLLAPEAEGVKAAQAAYEAAVAAGDIAEVAATTKRLYDAKHALAALDVLNPVSAISKVGGKTAAAVEGALPAGNIAKILGSGARGALETGLFTAGDLVNESQTGDPSFNGESIGHQIGIGAVIGGVFGSVLEASILGAKGAKSKLFGDAVKTAEKAVAKEGALQTVAESEAKELAEKDAFKIPYAEAEELVQANELREAAPHVDLPAGSEILPAQIKQFESKADHEVMQTLRDSNSEAGAQLRNREVKQKKDLTKIIESSVESLSEQPAARDSIHAGQRIEKAANDLIKQNRAHEAELFEKLAGMADNKINHPGALLDTVEKAIPGAGKFLEHEGVDGLVKLPKYNDITMPWSKEVHTALEKIVSAVNTEGLNFQNVRNARMRVREMLDKSFQSGLSKQSKAQLSSLSAGLMDFMQNEAADKFANNEIRGAFKRYAINEQNSTRLQQILGGVFEGEGKKKIVSEKVLGKIFSNTNTVTDVRKILGDKAFNAILKDYMAELIHVSTDNTRGGFSSAKFRNILGWGRGGKGAMLERAFEGNPDALKKIKSANTMMRLIPDFPSANPSGTAKMKSGFDKFAEVGDTALMLLSPKLAIMKMAGETLKKRLNAEIPLAAHTLKGIESGMAAAEARKAAEEKILHLRVLNKILEAKESATRKIDKGLNATFKTIDVAYPKAISMAIRKKSEPIEPLSERYEDAAKKVKFMAENQGEAINRLTESTNMLNKFAPETTQAFHGSVTRAIAYLGTKLPQEPQRMPLDPKFNPPHQQMAEFMNAYEMAEDPMSVFEHMQRGTLTSGHVEALNVIHPATASQIKRGILERLNPDKLPPYQNRMMLSMMLGSPISSSMTPNSILSVQNSYAAPSSKPGDSQATARPPTQKGLEKIGIADRILTPMQKTNMRS